MTPAAAIGALLFGPGPGGIEEEAPAGPVVVVGLTGSPVLDAPGGLVVGGLVSPALDLLASPAAAPVGVAALEPANVPTKVVVACRISATKYPGLLVLRTVMPALPFTITVGSPTSSGSSVTAW